MRALPLWDEGVRKGPEEPTLFEQFVRRLHLPYPVVCLLLAIIPGYAASNFGETIVAWPVWTLEAFYMLYVIRYMRLKVVSAEARLASLCPQGKATFHRVFGRLSRPRPQAFLILVVVGISFAYFSRLFRFTGPFYLVLSSTTLIVFSVAWGTVVWVYLSSIQGLHLLGKGPLNLKSYHEDIMLGVRPLGSLSLHLTFVYLSVIGLGAIATSFFADLFMIVSITVFAIIGIAMFFLPLRSIHRLMSQEKNRAESAIRSQYLQLASQPESRMPASSDMTMAGLGSLLADVKGLLAIGMAEHRVESIPTWPFDGKILGRLFLVSLSVVAILLARVAIVALHL